nr:hypothetical protein [Acholeplasmatales bacterium]
MQTVCESRIRPIFSLKTIKMVIIVLTIFASFVFYVTNNFYVFLGIAIPTIIFALYVTYYDEKYSIFVCLFLATNALGLWPSISMLGGVFSWSDLGIIWSIYMFFLMIINRRKYHFEPIGLLMLLYFVFIIIGSINAFRIYNQEVLVGLLVF